MSDSNQGNLRTIGSAVLLAMFIRIVLFEAFEIEGPSMEPTLLNGDRVVVAKFSYGLFLPFMTDAVLTWGQPDVGDVVIVKSPRDDVDIVKRVVGVPGDHIEIRDGVVWRNGEQVDQVVRGECEDDDDRAPDPYAGSCQWFEEHLGDHVYRISRNADSLRSNRSEITLEPGTIFVLGDHRDRSNDSRQLGPIPIHRVKGHVLSIYWSSRGGAAGCMSWDGLRGERMFHSVD